MKKSIIATGAASLALAAMPVVGVFAADAGSASVVDNVTVVINESCTFQAKTDETTSTVVDPQNGVITRNFRKEATLGSTVYLGDDAEGGSGSYPTGDPAIVIEGVCNSDGTSSDPAKTGTWTISALGSNGAKMVKTGSEPTDSGNIPTGLAESGTASAWAMKIAGSTTSTGAGSATYGDWSEIPSASATPVHTGTAKGQKITFKPQYRVYVGTEQASGTYTGTVIYTIASTWTAQP